MDRELWNKFLIERLFRNPTMFNLWFLIELGFLSRFEVRMELMEDENV